LATASPRTASPIYWAGLNIVGNNDTILLKENNYYWWFALISRDWWILVQEEEKIAKIKPDSTSFLRAVFFLVGVVTIAFYRFKLSLASLFCCSLLSAKPNRFCLIIKDTLLLCGYFAKIFRANFF
jgi:hypothetical protein